MEQRRKDARKGPIIIDIDSLVPADHLLRKIKPFVIDRKNCLFANTPKGATSSAVMFSLIQTAIENSLDPYKYLTWLLKRAKDADLADAETIRGLLPWNAIPERRTQ